MTITKEEREQIIREYHRREVIIETGHDPDAQPEKKLTELEEYIIRQRIIESGHVP